MFNLRRLELHAGSLRPKNGFSMVELLVVLFLIAFMIAFLPIVFVNQSKRTKIQAARTLLHKLDVALNEYYSVFKEYPPDSGYGLPQDQGGSYPNVHYDPGTLHRYLGKQIQWMKPKTGGGYV